MNELNERTSKKSIFSYQRLIFRYKLAKKFLKQGSVLDIGCGGEGLIFNYISQEGYTGVDYSPKTVETISSKFPDAKFFCQESPPLDFPDSTFDNILCLEMIEHIPEDKAPVLLDEIFRCLKKGGYLLLSTPNALNRGKHYPEGHIKEYTVNEMEGLIHSAGFTVTKKTGLFLSLMKERNRADMFSKLRANLYQSLQPKTQDTNFDKKEPNNIHKEKTSISFHKKLLKQALIQLAKLICFMGYVFPKKAEYQVFLASKK
tara:strand:- start:1341 stop:2117 length:777 start_codon:yes stop_codon:yes gene_type:complete